MDLILQWLGVDLKTKTLLMLLMVLVLVGDVGHTSSYANGTSNGFTTSFTQICSNIYPYSIPKIKMNIPYHKTRKNIS